VTDPSRPTGAAAPAPPVHPIEAESYRIIGERVDLSDWDPLDRAVVARVIHAAADIGYASTMRLTPGAVAAGVRALRAGAPVIADVEMVAAATRRSGTRSLLDEGRVERDAAGEDGLTVSAAAMRVAARRWPVGAVVVIGNAPTALFEVVALATARATQSGEGTGTQGGEDAADAAGDHRHAEQRRAGMSPSGAGARTSPRGDTTRAAQVGAAPRAGQLGAGAGFVPALVIGMPVGFVGAAEAKAALRASPLRSVSNVGERGGSAVAAAALNAIARLAADPAVTVDPVGGR
jgi:precorrin-8X/cobalt-precorrin-8 methylmutase